MENQTGSGEVSDPKVTRSLGMVLKAVTDALERKREVKLASFNAATDPSERADAIREVWFLSMGRTSNDRFNSAIGYLSANSVSFREWWNTMNHEERVAFKNQYIRDDR